LEYEVINSLTIYNHHLAKNMDLTTLLQIIISLVFIYLILSLVVSELQEQLTALSEFRARNLKKAIEIFLGEKVAGELYNSNTLFSAYNQYTNQWNEKFLFGKSLGPSYIDSKVFAESLLTLVNEKIVDDENKLQVNDLLVYASENSASQTLEKGLPSEDSASQTPEQRSSSVSRKGVIRKLKTIENEDYTEVIKKLVEIANLTKLKHDQPTLTNFIDEVATTFSQIMERTSGVYKRNAKGISLLFGLFAAGLFNIDTLYIVDQLYKSTVLRDSLDTAATNVFEQNQPCFDAARKLTKPEEITAEEQTCEEELKSNIDTLKASADFPPLPVGWKDGKIGNFYSQPTAVFCWLISAIAISMGAPFWFDLLSKVINVRNTVKPVVPPSEPVDEE
jgi:hypothetical protein